jgi:pimeloyl-ACP methyl ester carboxylesterase
VWLPGPHGPLAALTAAPPDPAATVLMVPGYTGSKEDFAPLLDAVADAGFAALAIDLPGQYESPGPPDEAAYLPAALGPVVAQLVLRLAPRPVLLLGHSYGGLVSRAAVLAGARVAGLVLLGSGPAALPDGTRRSLLDLGEPVLRAHGVHAVQQLREAANAGQPPQPPELAELLRRRFVASSAAGLLGMATGLRTEPDRVAELAAVLAPAGPPCLVACGELDDAWPPEAQRAMAARLGARFATIPGAAHSPNVENPAALLELLLPTWRAWLGC